MHLDDVIGEIVGGALAGSSGLSIYIIALCAAYIPWGLGPIFAVVGLVRAERPHWPAIVGLFMCVLPILTTVLFNRYGNGQS